MSNITKIANKSYRQDATGQWFVWTNEGTLCLSISVIEGAMPSGLVCTCGGQVELMGVVRGQRLHVATELRCPCDGRCTHAKGPLCDCSCGGANHGTGRVVRIEHYENIPRIQSGTPEYATEFLAAVAAAHTRMLATFGTREGWEPERIHVARQAARQDYNRAGTMKSHAGRMRVLKSICAKPLTAAEQTELANRAEQQRQAAATEQARTDAIAAEKAKRVHVGTVGERITRQVTVEVAIRFPGGGYTGGMRYLVIFRDADGNQLVTWTESLMVTIEASGRPVPEWSHAEITGTVKEHGRYNGEAQTVLTRVRATALETADLTQPVN